VQTQPEPKTWSARRLQEQVAAEDPKPLFLLLPLTDNEQKSAFYSRAGHWANNWSGIDVLMFFFIHGCILHCEEEILEDLGSYSPGTLLMIFTICKVFDEILLDILVWRLKRIKRYF
jgi:hypothetical protein